MSKRFTTTFGPKFAWGSHTVYLAWHFTLAHSSVCPKCQMLLFSAAISFRGHQPLTKFSHISCTFWLTEPKLILCFNRGVSKSKKQENKQARVSKILVVSILYTQSNGQKPQISNILEQLYLFSFSIIIFNTFKQFKSRFCIDFSAALTIFL